MNELTKGQKVKIEVARGPIGSNEDNFIYGTVLLIDGDQITVETKEFGITVYPRNKVITVYPRNKVITD